MKGTKYYHTYNTTRYDVHVHVTCIKIPHNTFNQSAMGGRGGETGEVCCGCIPSFAGSSPLFSSSIIVDVAPVGGSSDCGSSGYGSSEAVTVVSVGVDPVTVAPVGMDPVSVVSVGVDPVIVVSVGVNPVTVVSVGGDPVTVVSVGVATAAGLIYKTNLFSPTQCSFPLLSSPLSLPPSFSSLLSLSLSSLSAPSPYSIVWLCCRY